MADASSLNPSDALTETQELFHGIASALNWGFWLFEPGEGWRFVFGVGGVLSAVGALKLYSSPSVSQEKSATYPAAILLTGTAFLFLYMTLRAWPVNSEGKAIRPAAYIVMILKGEKPPSGPAAPDNTAAIQGGLEAIAALWIVNKAASSISNLAGTAGVLGTMWTWIKGVFSKGADEGGIPDVPEMDIVVPVAPGLSGTQTV